MEPLTLYRKRIIPEECILLKDDIVVAQTDDIIMTKWRTLNPKIAFHHGCSCYFLKEGYKVSKFYREDDSLLYWYCDIVNYDYAASSNTLTVTDLLADVIVYPSGAVKVLDLDELAVALDRKLISEEQIKQALLHLNALLDIVYEDKFDRLQAEFKKYGL